MFSSKAESDVIYVLHGGTDIAALARALGILFI